MQMKNPSSNGDHFLVDLIEEYRRKHGTLPHNMDFVAAWALNEGKIKPSRRSMIKEVARQFSRAAHRRHHRDQQGRRVRTYHAAKYQKMTANGQLVFETMWDHIETMNTDFWRMSSSQRLSQIAGECRSLKRDDDSFADNNPNAAGYVSNLTFNFEPFLDGGPSEAEGLEPS
jgi:hypothetical protein